jgi:hypothetical protein
MSQKSWTQELKVGDKFMNLAVGNIATVLEVHGKSSISYQWDNFNGAVSKAIPFSQLKDHEKYWAPLTPLLEALL